MKMTLYTLLFLGCFLPNTAFTQSSFLDSTFADNGRALITLNVNGNYCRFDHVGLQSDGKIIAIGSTSANGGSRAVAVRLHPDGSLDTSFGNGGEWYSADQYFLLGYEVLIQPDDKILITGWGAGLGRAVRLTPDGIYDNTFGSGGKSNFIIGGNGTTIMIDMELQPDGKILISGYKTPQSAIVRLNVDGTLDSTFGTGGIAIVTPSLFGAGADYVYGLKIGLSADNSILAAGIYSHPTKPSPGFVIRFKSDGQIDAAFGENGIAEFYYVAQQVSDLFVLPTDEILVLCDIQDSINFIPRVTLTKWLPNGQIDSSFANHGYAKLSIGDEGAFCRNGFLQPDGKVVVFGIWGYPTFPDTRSVMSRFNVDGSIDTTLGVGGVVPSQGLESFQDGLVQPDGKIISVSPYILASGTEYGNVRRYLPSNIVGTKESVSALTSAYLYPNPVTEQALTISYELTAASKIKIDLVNLMGETLGTLLNADRKLGINEEVIKLPDALENGTYFVHIQSESGNAVAKMLLARR